MHSPSLIIKKPTSIEMVVSCSNSLSSGIKYYELEYDKHNFSIFISCGEKPVFEHFTSLVLGPSRIMLIASIGRKQLYNCLIVIILLISFAELIRQACE